MHINIQVPDGRKGSWEIRSFEVTKALADFENYRTGGHRRISAGIYKGLYFMENSPKGYPVMSNTPAEIKDLLPFINQAKGDILIFGLGLGVVVQALIDNPRVTSIKVIEKEVDVIELAGKYYTALSSRVKILQGDAFTYKDQGSYDAIWFDIWNQIDMENVPQMKELKKRWRKQADVMMCWAEKECKQILRKDRKRQLA